MKSRGRAASVKRKPRRTAAPAQRQQAPARRQSAAKRANGPAPEGERHQTALVALLREALVTSQRPRFLSAVAGLVLRTLDAERVELLKFRQPGRCELEAGCGGPPGAQGATLVPHLTWSGRSILAADRVVPLDVLWERDGPASNGRPAPHGLATALRFRGKMSGLLAVSTRRAQGFTRTDGTFLASVSRIVQSYSERSERAAEDFRESLQIHTSIEQIKKSQEWLNVSLEFKNRRLAEVNDALRKEVEARRRAENDLRMLVEVIAAAAEAHEVPGMLGTCLERICELGDWQVGLCWVVDRPSHSLTCLSGVWHAEIEASGLRLASLARQVVHSAGWLGRVWETCQPALLPDLAQAENFDRAPEAVAARLQSVFALPIIATRGLVAVLELFSVKTRNEDSIPRSVPQLGKHLGLVFERLESEAELHCTRHFVDRIIISSQEGIVSFDCRLCCTLWNRAMEGFFGLSESEALGRSILELLPFLSDTGEENALRQVLAGMSPSGKDCSYARAKGGLRLFETYYSPIWELEGVDRRVIGGLAILRDITARKRAEESFRGLSRRLLRLQDEERSRIARELHDSTGQTLTAAVLSLMRLEAVVGKLDPAAAEALSEGKRLLADASREIRSISYLVYPPELGSMGLAENLRAYAEGFEKRTGVSVEMVIPETLGALPEEVSIAFFRTAQQCLANLHRHSGSSTCKIRLELAPDRLELEVADQGCGIPPGVLDAASSGSSVSGVGISGMRDRLQQLGGCLQIHTNSQGTQVIATLPRSSFEPAAATKVGSRE